MTEPANPTPNPAPDAEAVRGAITAAIGKADADFGYSFNLTRLVDGEETYTLRMPGFEPVEFEDRDEGYALIEQRRNRVRADAVLAAIRALDLSAFGPTVSKMESVAPPSSSEAALREALEQALQEAKVANEVIRLGRYPTGGGRVKIATALHRIEKLLAALQSQEPRG